MNAFLYHKIVYQEVEKTVTYELPDVDDDHLTDIITKINSGEKPKEIISITDEERVLDQDVYFEVDDLRSPKFRNEGKIRVLQNQIEYLKQEKC